MSEVIDLGVYKKKKKKEDAEREQHPKTAMECFDQNLNRIRKEKQDRRKLNDPDRVR